MSIVKNSESHYVTVLDMYGSFIFIPSYIQVNILDDKKLRQQQQGKWPGAQFVDSPYQTTRQKNEAVFDSFFSVEETLHAFRVHKYK